MESAEGERFAGSTSEACCARATSRMQFVLDAAQRSKFDTAVRNPSRICNPIDLFHICILNPTRAFANSLSREMN